MKKESKKKIEIKEGKELIYMQPTFMLGAVLFDYVRLKIIKIFKKSARVERLEETPSHGGNVPLERFNECYFESMEEAIEWNKKYILKPHITEWSKELEGFTKKHPKWNNMVNNINRLKGYLKVLENGFSIKAIKEVEKNNPIKTKLGDW